MESKKEGRESGGEKREKEEEKKERGEEVREDTIYIITAEIERTKFK